MLCRVPLCIPVGRSEDGEDLLLQPHAGEWYGTLPSRGQWIHIPAKGRSSITVNGERSPENGYRTWQHRQECSLVCTSWTSGRGAEP